jgi:Tol biopolymer transport system component
MFRRMRGNDFDTFVMNRDGSNIQPFQLPSEHTVRGVTVAEQRRGAGQAIVVKKGGEAFREISKVTWAEQPSVSPDGRLVVFEQRADPNDIIGSDIAVWDVASGQTRIIARGTDPSWSPDGRTLLFKSPGPKQALFITVADVATGKTRTLTPGVHPHWSPDGTRILYMADRPDRADAYVIAATGGEPRCLTCDWK